VQLLERRPRGVVLTPAGATFYASARRILAEASRVRDKLARSHFAGKPAVTIGVPPTLAGLLLPGCWRPAPHTGGHRAEEPGSLHPRAAGNGLNAVLSTWP